MKFVVQKTYSNEYDVKLHDDSKDKLKRVAWVGYWIACGAAGIYLVKNILTDKKSEPESK